jgi:nucleoid-associated protein EbfC
MRAEFEPAVDEVLTRMRRHQREIERIQRGVDALMITGFSTAREVAVTVRGTGRIAEVAIDPATVRRHDVRELGVIITEAANDAQDRLAAATRARFAAG